MAGIYVHIPFCKQACTYCNFHFSTSLKLRNDFVGALLAEMAMRRNYAGGEPVGTIYFGGGTPSLLSSSELQQIIGAIQVNFDVSARAEITLEANPDDINDEALRRWRDMGFNRLSIGVQSFFESHLRAMNRAHSAGQASACIAAAKAAGFGNFSIDLIYGSPDLNDEQWMANLATAVDLGIPHLSCYALTVEPGTLLDNLTRRKQVPPVASEDQARQFLLMTDYLTSKGYEHYEISNFALPGKRSRHNSAYWNGSRYIGLGPSAHSFDGENRQWNISNNALYIRTIQEGELFLEKEKLSPRDRFNEYVMTSLRTMEGTDLNMVRNQFGGRAADSLTAASEKFMDRAWLTIDNEKLVLTREGKLFADGIAADLFQS